MSAPQLLRSLAFTSYRELLGELLPPASRFAVSDAEGTVYWADADFPQSAPPKALDDASADAKSAAANVGEIRRIPLHAGALYATPMLIDSTKEVTYLWALTPTHTDADRVAKSLSSAAVVVARDLNLNAELDGMASELAERHEQLRLVQHAEDRVTQVAEGKNALSDLVRNCCDYSRAGMAALVMRDEGVTVSHESGDWRKIGRDSVLDKVRSKIYDKVVAHKDVLVINDLSSPEAQALWQEREQRLLAAPMLDKDGKVDGILVLVKDCDRPKFSDGDRNLLQAMARKAAKIVRINYDSLTGLAGRDAFEFLAASRIADAQNRGATHSLLHIDIDELDVINDTISRQAGDIVIQSVAALLRRSVRNSDIVARLGADEFAILVANCTLQLGATIAHKLRRGIVDLTIPWPKQPLSATVSVGVAPVDSGTESAAAAIAAAERASAAMDLGETWAAPRHRKMERVELQTAVQAERRRATIGGLKLADAEARRRAHEEVWDTLACGVVLLDNVGQVLWANRAATAILASGDGLAVRHGFLAAANATQNAALQLLVRETIAAEPRWTPRPDASLSVSRPSGARPLAVLTSPVRPQPSLARSPAAVVFVTDPEREPEPAPELLKRLYGFTAREAALAVLLLRGHDLCEAAEKLSVSVHTVRTLLHFIFDRTGTHRQSDLVALLLRGPAGLR